jgi:hypothetical protein
MFYALGLIFDGPEGVGSPGLVFGGTEALGSLFMFCVSEPIFGDIEVAEVEFSYFALPDSFQAVPRVPSPIFKFCATRLVWGSTEDVGSNFHVLRSRTHFRRYRGRRV